MLVGGILGFVFRGKVETTIIIGMESSLRDYGNYKAITNAWDETQTRYVELMQFCGIYKLHKNIGFVKSVKIIFIHILLKH